MSRSLIVQLLASLALLAAGGLAWKIRLAPDLELDASPLLEFPYEIGGWDSIDLEMDDGVAEALRADFNLQRGYYRPSGDQIWLYIGYYGTARGGRPEHTPRTCYVAAGWGIEETRVVRPRRGEPFRVNEYFVERDGERRLVLFWYRSHRRSGMIGGIDQNLDRLRGHLFDGRADGALVRVSTRLDGRSLFTIRSQLLSFAMMVDEELARRWPVEGADLEGHAVPLGSSSRVERVPETPTGRAHAGLGPRTRREVAWPRRFAHAMIFDGGRRLAAL